MDRVAEELWKILPINEVFHVLIHRTILSAVWMSQVVNSALKFAAIVNDFTAEQFCELVII